MNKNDIKRRLESSNIRLHQDLQEEASSMQNWLDLIKDGIMPYSVDVFEKHTFTMALLMKRIDTQRLVINMIDLNSDRQFI